MARDDMEVDTERTLQLMAQLDERGIVYERAVVRVGPGKNQKTVYLATAVVNETAYHREVGYQAAFVQDWYGGIVEGWLNKMIDDLVEDATKEAHGT